MSMWWWDPELITYHHRSKKLGFEKGKLATNARPRGKAPRMVGIGMSVRNCLATAHLSRMDILLKDSKMQIGEMTPWVQSIGSIQLASSKIGSNVKVQSIFNPNESKWIIWFMRNLTWLCISMLAPLASGENRSGLKLNGSPNSPPQYLDCGLFCCAQIHCILHCFSTKQPGCTYQYREELLKTVISHHLTLSSMLHSAYRNLKQIPLLR